MTEEGFSFILPPDDDEAPVEGISYQIESVDFELSQAAVLDAWIEKVITRENCRLINLNYVFCSDEYLHQINVEYLDHDTLTDIITFPYADPPVIHGDIFISIDRIRENAEELQLDFRDELHRVMIHGVLHLCGYGDKSPQEKERMTRKEDEALSLIP